MTTPDILETAGFKKTKLGRGDKDLGYTIERSRLRKLSGVVVLGLGVLSCIGIGSQFEVHFERRRSHKQIRKEEHHAANKLAKLEMELWSHYRDDVKESGLAKSIFGKMSATQSRFESRVKESVESLSKDLGLKQDKAVALTNTILHLVADLQTNNTRLTKNLVDHLVKQGQKSVALEKHAEKEAAKEVKEESEKEAGEDEEDDADDAEDDEDLQALVNGFFEAFHMFENEFPGPAREALSKEDHPVAKQIAALQKKVESDDPPEDEEILKELATIDFASIGASLRQNISLDDAEDVVDEMYLIDRIPYETIRTLEEVWKAKKKGADDVMDEMFEWQKQGLVPASWLSKGVDAAEDEDEADEEKDEEEEADDGAGKKGKSA